jgi:hypothetical protein
MPNLICKYHNNLLAQQFPGCSNAVHMSYVIMMQGCGSVTVVFVRRVCGQNHLRNGMYESSVCRPKDWSTLSWVFVQAATCCAMWVTHAANVTWPQWLNLKRIILVSRYKMYERRKYM